MKIDWQKGDGLVPVVVQSPDRLVLMLGYANEPALAKTLESGLVTFFSRSRQQLWTKGETSGNYLKYIDHKVDCDGDTILVTAIPSGPVCHQGTATCFGHKTGFLSELGSIIKDRRSQSPSESYTAKLFAEGNKRMARKVGEEGVEVALAGMAGDRDELNNEAADLLFHLLVLLEQNNSSLSLVEEVLLSRHR